MIVICTDIVSLESEVTVSFPSELPINLMKLLFLILDIDVSIKLLDKFTLNILILGTSLKRTTSLFRLFTNFNESIKAGNVFSDTLMV